MRDCRQTACRCRCGAAPLASSVVRAAAPNSQTRGGSTLFLHVPKRASVWSLPLAWSLSRLPHAMWSMRSLRAAIACARPQPLRSLAIAPHSPLRALCSAAPDAASSSSTPVLLQLPPMSKRKERIQKHGLISMTTDFAKLALARQEGKVGNVDDTFRVQTYTVPVNRPAEFAVSKVYGFGRSRSKWLAAEIGVFGHFKLSKMRESQRAYLRRTLNAACIAYDDPKQAAGAALKKEISLNIQRLKDIRCYRGVRHDLFLPCRGQRTKTNARTRRRLRHRVF